MRRASGWRSRMLESSAPVAWRAAWGSMTENWGLGGSKERRSGASVDSSCLEMTLKSGLDKMRSNSLSTRGCGERRQMESLGADERLVATVVRVVKTGRTGKRVGTSCSRIDTDNLGVLKWGVGVQSRRTGAK